MLRSSLFALVSLPVVQGGTQGRMPPGKHSNGIVCAAVSHGQKRCAGAGVLSRILKIRKCGVTGETEKAGGCCGIPLHFRHKQNII